MKYKNKKDKFRKYVIEKTKKRKINNYKKDKLLSKELLKYIEEKGYKNVMLYIPLKREVNIKGLIKTLRQKGCNLYTPFMEGKSFRLVKYRLPLQVKKFKIKEAKVSNFKVKNIDIALVPIVGIDISFRRIGFGKGMYDRFFQKNKKIIKETIFVERDLYICKTIITDKYDISANCLFTSSINFIEI